MKGGSVIAAVAAALALTLGLSGVVAADSTTGSVGHYLVTDGNSVATAGAACLYSTPGGGIYNIYRIVGRRPSVWWPDTNSSISGQHGTVGWRLIVKYKSPSATSWTLLKQTTIQKATAHEDSPAYDPNDKAAFSNLWININYANFSQANTTFKALIKIYWFRSDGSVRGTATHTVQNYATKGSALSDSVNAFGYCYRSFGVF